MSDEIFLFKCINSKYVHIIDTFLPKVCLSCILFPIKHYSTVCSEQALIHFTSLSICEILGMSLLAELSVKKKNTRHACFPSRYLKSEKNVFFFKNN